MNLVEWIFYKKMQGVKRCPRGDADGGMEMDDYYAYFLPFCEAKDVTEQEE